MSRSPLHTVTFPLLIDSGRIEPRGWLTNRGGGFASVCAISEKELIDQSGAFLGPKALGLFRGLDLLKRAFEAKDWWELTDAVKLLRPYYPPLRPGMTRIEDWSGNNKWEGARWLYSEQMTREVSRCRLVMWFPNDGTGLLSPAIYCPNLKTAAFVALFRGGMRVCPRCGILYVPDKETRDYCTPAHGIAYRTARSRGNRKLREDELREAKKRKAKK
jgi:hypothetical protein